jgi:hypothetical protein
MMSFLFRFDLRRVNYTIYRQRIDLKMQRIGLKISIPAGRAGGFAENA